MSFLIGFVVGIGVGAVLRARSLGGLKKDLTQIAARVSPETREATEHVENSLTERFRHAQDAYTTSLEATRVHLQQEFEAARSARP